MQHAHTPIAAVYVCLRPRNLLPIGCLLLALMAFLCWCLLLQNTVRNRDDGSGGETEYPRWVHIEQNLIMNGPSGNRNLGNLFPCIDNDDGSAYYFVSENVCVYGGAF